jgi:putative flippase GtrA
MSAFINHKENKRFIKFALVGISGTVVDFSVFNLLNSLFNLTGIISIFSVETVIISSVLSFIIAVINNYHWNRNWTYPESKQFSHTDQLFKFGTVSLIGLIIRTPMFAWIREPLTNNFVDLIGDNFFLSPEILGQNVALAAVIVVVLFWNYFINRIWTYKNI